MHFNDRPVGPATGSQRKSHWPVGPAAGSERVKCLLYKMASIFLQPVVFIIENNSSCSIETIDTSSKNFLGHG